jgi:gas vesicle protein
LTEAISRFQAETSFARLEAYRMKNRRDSIDGLGDVRNGADNPARTEEPVSDKGREFASLLVGFGVGVGLAILFAPQSGSETREWISVNVEDGFRQVRRRGRRLVFEAQDLLDRGEHTVSRALRTGKHVLESVADRLD